MHAMPLLSGGVADYPDRGSRPPGHLASYKVIHGGLLGRPPRSGAPGIPAPVCQQDKGAERRITAFGHVPGAGTYQCRTPGSPDLTGHVEKERPGALAPP